MTQKRRLMPVIAAFAVILVAAGVIAFFVSSVEPMAIEGPSMEPGWVDGDRVVVDDLSGDPRPGDVVILRHPREETLVIKRVIGVAGEEILHEGFFVSRGGEPITATRVGTADGFICFEEGLSGRRFRTKRDPLMATGESEPVVVPEGHVYVLGDHRARSDDSRSFGTIPVERIVGLVGEHSFRASPRDPCEGAP